MSSNDRTIESADALYATGATAEVAADFDTAFSSYLAAAQSYLHLARTLPTTRARDRERCRNAARTSLERAERIKEAKKDVLKPLTRDFFSKTEQEFVLNRSSRIHGTLFPAWNGRSVSDADNSELQGALPLGPILSIESPVWKRPQDVWPKDKLALASPALHPQSIRQNIVTDCSVCTAIAICLHHHRKFASKLGLDCVYPQATNGMPVFATDGRYSFRFFINGAFRRISIDDLLPFYTDGRPISASAAHITGGFDLWPSLVEKAYMRLMGGYDFPGSNSSIDVYAFTGWIPEHIDIRSSIFVREKAWRRIKGGFQLGSCLVTLGTGVQGTSLSVQSSSGLEVGLLPTHSYAVLDVREDADGSQRRVTFLDPWTSIPKSTEQSGSSDISEGMRDLRLENNTFGEDGATADSMCECDTIEITWDDVCDVFDGIYLNWDPSLFKNSLEFHGSWIKKENKADEAPGCTHQHLMLSLSSPKDRKPGEADQPEQLWVLLTRHLVDKQRSKEFINLHASEEEHQEGDGRHNIDDMTNVSLKATYTSSTHVLTRLTLTGPETQVAIVASYEGSYTEVCYSVKAFSARAELSWVKHPRISAYERTLEGILSARNSGGNCTFPTFMNNPQYKLRVHPESERPGNSPVSYSPTSPSGSRRSSGHAEHLERRKQLKSRLRIVAEGPRNVPFNITLVWRNEKESGERVLQLTDSDVTSTSGAYSYGVAQTTASITSGHYCIIVSAFEPRHRGSFTLRLESSARIDVESISSEGAGMFCKTVEAAWTEGTDAGSPQFGNFNKNPTYIIDIRTSTVLKMRLQLTKSSPIIALNASLFSSFLPPSPGGRSLIPGLLVSTSGAYVDSPAGAATPPTPLAPGRYLAVVSTFDPGARVQFRLLVYASTVVEVWPLADGMGDGQYTLGVVRELPDG